MGDDEYRVCEHGSFKTIACPICFQRIEGDLTGARLTIARLERELDEARNPNVLALMRLNAKCTRESNRICQAVVSFLCDSSDSGEALIDSLPVRWSETIAEKQP